MPQLSATFSIVISSPCLMALPDEQVPDVTVELDSFKVTARLIPTGRFHKGKGEANWTTGLSKLEVAVSRDEDDSPPDVIETPDGRRDLTVQGDYLWSKLPAYQVVALEVANRVLRFFQYSLLTPLVRPISSWDHALHNPTWRDSEGQVLIGGAHTIVVAKPVPGVRGQLGARKLRPTDLPELHAFLAKPNEAPLADTLLSDAQAAWFEDSLRRAVLELAICAEVLVKGRFFSRDSPAGAAFDYLEDKAKVSVRVLELLDRVAEEAFSRSYKKEQLSNYQRIDYLFRCRNKIAHRGELLFKDDSGQLIPVDAPMVETWWHAVANLKGWLEMVEK